MATDHAPHLYNLGQPSTSYMSYMDGVNNRHRLQVNGGPSEQATLVNGTGEYSEPLLGESDSEDPDLPAGVAGGNWGKKALKGSRWVRRGKAVAWGPSKGEWEAEERARKRLKMMLAPPRRSPSPPTLPHLRESSPPLGAPYVHPSTHGSYAAFVLDPAVAHSYCTPMLTDLEQTTDNLIQGEATLTRALGRLWKVLSEEEHVRQDDDPGMKTGVAGLTNGVVDDGADGEKHDDAVDDGDEEMSERERRVARAPDLSQPMHKLFLTPFPNGGTHMMEPSHFGSPQMQLENMERAFATLRELQDDSREYVERLAEARENLGDVRRQRDIIWMKTREQALEELKEIDQAPADSDGEPDVLKDLAKYFNS
ncbi:hypothetical protein ACEPAG_1023 [Sanghuangporus baumii]